MSLRITPALLPMEPEEHGGAELDLVAELADVAGPLAAPLRRALRLTEPATGLSRCGAVTCRGFPDPTTCAATMR